MSDHPSATNDNVTGSRDARRKKILFRCWHRGMKEMDLLLGGFANAKIDELNEDELRELEHLLTAHDQDLYAWMTGRKPLPAEWDGPLYRRIIAYHEAAGPAGFVK
ncbi:MAG: succinate dehydrogenase assembly factor 2 [Labrenzia sp.]|jgi:antitoxin CptB|uniref:FAD assembly factor SdhE n=1 Tax=Roseibium alexandrii TaxID=388408 RepID=A0A0M6ZPE1_9HYPH|nr:succinate dehydrogenase assembly factor 2 [Roseibium alexandrii]CTQ64217.1 Flavinator of succinate dehydrogenase [Roseibium alexandrii]